MNKLDAVATSDGDRGLFYQIAGAGEPRRDGKGMRS